MNLLYITSVLAYNYLYLDMQGPFNEFQTKIPIKIN